MENKFFKHLGQKIMPVVVFLSLNEAVKSNPVPEIYKENFIEHGLTNREIVSNLPEGVYNFETGDSTKRESIEYTVLIKDDLKTITAIVKYKNGYILEMRDGGTVVTQIEDTATNQNTQVFSPDSNSNNINYVYNKKNVSADGIIDFALLKNKKGEKIDDLNVHEKYTIENQEKKNVISTEDLPQFYAVQAKYVDLTKKVQESTFTQ